MMCKQLLIILSLLVVLPTAYAWDKGIYVTQSSVENTRTLNYLIYRSHETGINTFVIDMKHYSNAYARNIKLVHDSGIKYVARIVVFPRGGYDAQVKSKNYWEQKFRLVQHAINLGAKEIQLDYIRYRPSQRPSSQNAKNINEVIKWFKDKVAQQGIPLQIDTFGVANKGESRYIGQNLLLFADNIDALCPMPYPSHHEPYRMHAKQPYETVHTSLLDLKKQFNYNIPFRVYPFIELYNYRYPLSKRQKYDYIYAQIRAVEDSGMNGWYAWNPSNQYDNLFHVLENYEVK